MKKKYYLKGVKLKKKKKVLKYFLTEKNAFLPMLSMLPDVPHGVKKGKKG